MERLLTLQYYFTPRPDSNFQYTKLTLLLIALLLIFSLAIKVYRKKHVKEAILKKMLKKYPNRFFSFALILLFLLVVREAGIPFLSMRLWWFLLFGYIIYWCIKVALNFKKEYHKRLTQTHHNKNYKKWIPKKKK